MVEYETTYSVTYDEGIWSTVKYYAKRFSKHAISFVVAALITYATGKEEFIALIPVLEILQKIAKEKGYWY